jgi:hypothetical protein
MQRHQDGVALPLSVGKGLGKPMVHLCDLCLRLR